MAVIDGLNINGAEYDIRDKASVRFDGAQQLTDEQKAQARANIDAASVTALQAQAEATAEALAGKVALNQGAANAGKVLLVDEDGSVVPGKARNGFNDAFRHYLEGALRAGMFTEDVSVMITRIAAAMLGVDGALQSGTVLRVDYSLNDPVKTGAELVFL